MTWRIGAVSYLNTKPLIYQLERHLPDCEVALDLPSRLADRLNAGDLDVALIPSVEFLRGAGLTIVSDACIACRGQVRSVRLLFRRPPHETQSLALDEGSRTSAALAQVLLAERYCIRPELQQLEIDCEIANCDADAILVIGDRAMSLDTRAFYETWDLGQQWWDETGLPFVFAMWVARSTVAPEVSQALQAARDAGLNNLPEIVTREAPKYNLSQASCEEYFRRHLHFYLGSQERAGLQLFRDQATAIGIVPITSRIELISR